LPCELRDPDDDELRRLERGKADADVYDAAVHVVLGGGRTIALDEIRLAWRGTAQRTRSEKVVQEHADAEPKLRPQGFVLPHRSRLGNEIRGRRSKRHRLVRLTDESTYHDLNSRHPGHHE
jgi:hypothetical protein